MKLKIRDQNDILTLKVFNGILKDKPEILILKKILVTTDIKTKV